jgi:hypothetical protein
VNRSKYWDEYRQGSLAIHSVVAWGKHALDYKRLSASPFNTTLFFPTTLAQLRSSTLAEIIHTTLNSIAINSTTMASKATNTAPTLEPWTRLPTELKLSVLSYAFAHPSPINETEHKALFKSVLAPLMLNEEMRQLLPECCK